MSIEETILTDGENGSSPSEKPKFVPKRRTPYLLQDEVIKNKQREEKQLENKNYLFTAMQIKESSININNNQEYILKELTSDFSDRNTKEQKISSNRDSVTNQYSTLNYHEEIARLCGVQKKIIYYFAECCSMRGHNKTGPITAETLCTVTGSTKKTIKKIIQRTIEKKLVKRERGKRGKGGFAIFELDKELLDVIKLQSEIERNFFATVDNRTNLINQSKKDVHELPDDWNTIDFYSLLESFKCNPKLPTQFFGKAQLKSIFQSSRGKISATDIQNSISAFAYGYKNYFSEEPYKSMINPAAVLVDKLKNGDIWADKRYISDEEMMVFNIYKNVYEKIQKNFNEYFTKWKNINMQDKYEHYKSKARSNEYYDDRIFEEKALEDFKTNIWPFERKKIIQELMGLKDDAAVERFDGIIQSKSMAIIK